MKYFTLILLVSLLILLTVSCTSDTVLDKTVPIDEKAKQSSLTQTESSDLTDLTDLREAIALAKQNKDYRLLVTSGRSMSIPGVNAIDYETLVALCGKKYNSATGDVIQSQEQRLERKKHIEFMRQYNEQMVVICQKALNK